MKKPLLLTLGLALMANFAATADESFATYYPEGAVQHISPNGQYAAGTVMETTYYYDLANGKSYIFTPEVDSLGYFVNPLESYSLGNGNGVSNTGIVLCTNSLVGPTSYYDNGEWKLLSDKGSQAGEMMCVNGITPDGSRICGSLGTYQFTADEDVTMLNPCYWDRKDDGTYTDPIMLPFPEVVPLGRVPQYITANYISADGKVIAGQITEYSGMLQYPIVYIQDDKGEWSYKLVAEELFNPNHVVLPEQPTDYPIQPDATAYMTEEKAAEYAAAITKWQQSGYKEELYPNVVDYMTPEKGAEYEKDMAEYNAAAEEFNQKSDAFYTAFGEILDASPAFVFNNEFLTPDGKKYCITNEVSGATPWDNSTMEVWVIDIESNAVEKYVAPGYGATLSAVPNNDTFLCGQNEVLDPEAAVYYPSYICKDGNVTPIESYLRGFSDKVASWVDDYMIHEVEVYNYDTDEFDVVERLAVGIPAASADLKILALSCNPMWNKGSYQEAIIFDLDKLNTGVAAVEAAKDAVAVSVYNVGGVCLLNNVTPAAAEAAQLAKGVYVVKTTYADGTVKSAKLVK